MALLLGVYLPTIAFWGLVVGIQQSMMIAHCDVLILQSIHRTATPMLDQWAMTFTHFGVAWGVIPISTGVFLVLLYQRNWYWLSYWSIALLGNAILVHAAKFLFHRPRPHLWEPLRATATDFSFPSGHAMSSTILVVALTVLVWKTPWRSLSVVAGIGFMVAIGWTRLYLGVHFPSDILAGWLLATGWGIGVSQVFPMSSIAMSRNH